MTPESTPTWLIGPEIAPSSRIGSVLSGTYRLDAFLGQGLTGISYNAWHLRQKMPFSVKLLHRDLQPSHERVIRLRQDLRALAGLGPCGFLPMELSFAPDGAPFLAAELLVGETLRQRLSRGPMPSLAAGIAVASVARALSAAHRLNVVHGDLRPENIYIPALPGQEIAAGQPALLDAALHHLRRRPIGLDESLPLRKLAYLAPEQASGEVDVADAAGDIFALGAILYECLTGQQAFGANEIEVVLEKLAQPPERLSLPREVGAPPGLAEALGVVIAAACARDPEARIPLMQGLLDGLSLAYAGVGLPLPPADERLPVLSPGRARRSTVAQKKVVPLRPVGHPAEYLATDDEEMEIRVERGTPVPESGAHGAVPPSPPMGSAPRGPRATVRARDLSKLLLDVRAGRLDAALAVTLAGAGEELPAEGPREPTEADRIAEAGRAAVLARAEAARAAREGENTDRLRYEVEAEEASREAKRKVLEAARGEVLAKMRAELDEKKAERLERVAAARREAEVLEAERKEAEQKEAEHAERVRLSARQAEAARKEAARLEGERLAAERLGAEIEASMRREAERAEVARKEREILEAALKEAELKEAARKDAAAQAEALAEATRKEAAEREQEWQQAAAAWEAAARDMEEAEAEAKKEAVQENQAKAAARAQVAMKLATERLAEEERLSRQAREAEAAAKTAQEQSLAAAAEAQRAVEEEGRRAAAVQKAQAEMRTAEEAQRKEAAAREAAGREAAVARAGSEARLMEAALAQEAAREAEAEREIVAERISRVTQALAVVRQTCQIEIVDLGREISEMRTAPPPVPGPAAEAPLLAERPTLALDRSMLLVERPTGVVERPQGAAERSVMAGQMMALERSASALDMQPEGKAQGPVSGATYDSKEQRVSSGLHESPWQTPVGSLAQPVGAPYMVPVTGPNGEQVLVPAIPVTWLPEPRRGVSPRQMVAIFAATVVAAASLGALAVWLLVRRPSMPPEPLEGTTQAAQAPVVAPPRTSTVPVVATPPPVPVVPPPVPVVPPPVPVVLDTKPDEALPAPAESHPNRRPASVVLPPLRTLADRPVHSAERGIESGSTPTHGAARGPQRGPMNQDIRNPF